MVDEKLQKAILKMYEVISEFEVTDLIDESFPEFDFVCHKYDDLFNSFMDMLCIIGPKCPEDSELYKLHVAMLEDFAEDFNTNYPDFEDDLPFI